MPDLHKEDLIRRREALRQELSTIREAIVDIKAPEGGRTQMDKLQNLQTFLAIRERELNDVEARLSQRT